ncbi:hypothetical protein [Nocardia sp. BMG111209]|uniref:hypothetical protein n=1 Tax=Nocardia sp. BMG111209 TaxID=1160137 RepID=UPI000365A8E2|nr:hypothetical protein [Nocardia sp. BMG111209]
MILLGYRDHNVHELLCHEIADRAGYYDRLGVEVRAVPGADHPDAALSAGLGGSLIETLRGQRRWKVALVHTLHPLFWIWTRRSDFRSAGPTVLAGFPAGSIVDALTRKMLENHWAAAESPETLRYPGGSLGDRRRLEALTSGAADAAVIGSAFAPSAVVRLGLTDSLFFGATLRFPTAGLAVDSARMSLDDPAVRKIVAAQTAALTAIGERDPVALDAVTSLLHDAGRPDAHHFLADYLSPQYGPTPEDVRTAGADALDWLAAALGTGTDAATDFYEAIR